ncbi:MAG: transcriptional repressor [Candidatus Sumerlaeia bacterium]|nr:transcriptional repressor [Candidatus Sumerlaeia bacterium]
MERNTAQRAAVRQAFEESGRPMSPKEVLDAARPHAPSIGIATVYRAIKTLLEEQWISAVEIPGEPARYEVAGKPHHHHFLCRHCSKMYEVQGCLAGIRALAPAGFRLEAHHITLYGVCEDCLSAGR